jgi:hypothetical protein
VSVRGSEQGEGGRASRVSVSQGERASWVRGSEGGERERGEGASEEEGGGSKRQQEGGGQDVPPLY